MTGKNTLVTFYKKHFNQYFELLVLDLIKNHADGAWDKLSKIYTAY